jgi:formylglycine-generating enzyme required for sulfatase activity
MEHLHEEPAHKVKICYPFAVGQYEVTFEKWDRCVDAGACRNRRESQGTPRDAIGNLSWDDANAYLKWMSEATSQTYRLPSEEQWEYAAHSAISKASCNVCESVTKEQPSGVGFLKPNHFGLHDTAGKMAKWSEDCWNVSFHGVFAHGSA